MNQDTSATYRIGNTTVTKIPELTLTGFALTTLLPDLQIETLKEHPNWIDPVTLDPVTGNALLSVHTWLVKTPRHTILIDTGVGNDKQRPTIPVMHQLHNPYLERLAAAGVELDAVDYVLITHLHADHVGWNTRFVDGRWIPTFPNARYVFSELEQQYGRGLANQDVHAASALARARLGSPVRTPVAGVYADSVQPIIDAGLAQLIPIDGSEIVDGISFHPAPGHSIDHATILLRSHGAEAVFGGDTLHHPIEIYQLELVSMFCEFPEAARASRRSMLEHLVESGATYFSSHFPSASAGSVTRQNGAYAWKFL
jgi:glyoxylase-like metal-dependent hydrolase (beta-lactamase superfamily II)